jgi:hypothetical protein
VSWLCVSPLLLVLNYTRGRRRKRRRRRRMKKRTTR